MKMRAFWMLGLALLLAGAAVFLAQGWLGDQRQAAQKKEQKFVNLVVAKQPLYFGNTVRPEHLRVIKWPADVKMEGTFSSIDEILKDEEGKRTDRVALRQIDVSEPLLKTKISGFGGRATLSTVISEEMRAATIRVNDINGVAGFVLPGDRVDVMLTRDPDAGKTQAGKGDLITDVLLQNLKVLAVDQDASQQKDQPQVAKAVTLEVTPEQAQKLVLAQQVGFLSLALRNITDANAEQVKTVSVADLKVGEANNVDPTPDEAKDEAKPKKTVKVVRAPAKRDPRATVRVFRGTQSTQYNVIPEPKRRSAPAYSPSTSSGSSTGVVPRSLWQPAPKNDDDAGSTQEGKQPLSTNSGSGEEAEARRGDAESAPTSLLPVIENKAQANGG